VTSFLDLSVEHLKDPVFHMLVVLAQIPHRIWPSNLPASTYHVSHLVHGGKRQRGGPGQGQSRERRKVQVGSCQAAPAEWCPAAGTHRGSLPDNARSAKPEHAPRTGAEPHTGPCGCHPRVCTAPSSTEADLYRHRSLKQICLATLLLFSYSLSHSDPPRVATTMGINQGQKSWAYISESVPGARRQFAKQEDQLATLKQVFKSTDRQCCEPSASMLSGHSRSR
jgi:hypothetical protein